jgi:hypothetical protein
VQEFGIPRKEVKALSFLINGTVGIAVVTSTLGPLFLGFILWNNEMILYKQFLQLLQFIIPMEMSLGVSIVLTCLLAVFLIANCWVVTVPIVTKMLVYVVSQCIWMTALRKIW